MNGQPGPGSGYFDGNDLTGAGHLIHLVHTEPLRGGDEEGRSILAAEHTGESAPIGLDLVKHFTAFSYSVAIPLDAIDFSGPCEQHDRFSSAVTRLFIGEIKMGPF